MANQVRPASEGQEQTERSVHKAMERTSLYLQ